MQTLGHLLNFSVTNYSITLNGLICKGSFLPRERRLPRLHAELLDRLPGGGREGERQLGAPTVTLQLHKQFWQQYQVLPA